MKIKAKNDNERKIFCDIYANKADSIKFLLFFFKDKAQLRHFFNMFGGKTLVLPDTFEEYIEMCLKADIDIDKNRQGIDSSIHERTKDRILEKYFNLFSSLTDVIESECTAEKEQEEKIYARINSEK